MDRRIYVLPVASVIIILVLILRPDISGFVTARSLSQQSLIEAKASVTIASDGFIPENAVVTVFLDDESASMEFGDFVEKSGAAFDRRREQVPSIGYDGFGYGGEYTYFVDISQFGIDTLVGPGEHSLTVEVGYGESMLSTSSEKITI
ncbi:MAG: hypothetical protein NTU57_04915 [Candidatus Aenigmarchaeota archaeon]|nr:hypothetical protein [Candidatus Aenigmarchaeota archaeon]